MTATVATAFADTPARGSSSQEVNLEAIEETMAVLARARPVFHSEADFQHAFAWQLHSAYPAARIRLETRPRPGVRLDVMALINGQRVAVELKYLLRDLAATAEDELFELRFRARRMYAATTSSKTLPGSSCCWPTASPADSDKRAPRA